MTRYHKNEASRPVWSWTHNHQDHVEDTTVMKALVDQGKPRDPTPRT